MHFRHAHMLQRARLVSLLFAFGCGPRVHAQPEPACHAAPLAACTMGSAGDSVRGHVTIATILCSENQSGPCRASFAVSDDKNLGKVSLRGHDLGCAGPRNALCCPIDALHREVIAYGTLGHDEYHRWIDVTQICAP